MNYVFSGLEEASGIWCSWCTTGFREGLSIMLVKL